MTPFVFFNIFSFLFSYRLFYYLLLFFRFLYSLFLFSLTFFLYFYFYHTWYLTKKIFILWSVFFLPFLWNFIYVKAFILAQFLPLLSVFLSFFLSLFLSSLSFVSSFISFSSVFFLTYLAFFISFITFPNEQRLLFVWNKIRVWKGECCLLTGLDVRHASNVLFVVTWIKRNGHLVKLSNVRPVKRKQVPDLKNIMCTSVMNLTE